VADDVDITAVRQVDNGVFEKGAADGHTTDAGDGGIQT
jgi:hypothetical protein